MWTGNTARSASSFCYYYSDVDSEDSTIEQVSGVINDLYGPGCSVDPSSGAGSPAPPPLASNLAPGTNISGIRAVPRAVHQPAGALAALAQQVHNLVTDDGAMRDYMVNIQIDSMSLADSPTVYLFDGLAGDDVVSWKDSPNLLGKRTFLTKTMMSGGAGSQVKTGAISLNNALISRVREGRLGGMGNSEVSWYLKENMHWRVVKVSIVAQVLLK